MRQLCDKGSPIVGICGGFQMLGSSIEDPYGIENRGEPSTRRDSGSCPCELYCIRRRPFGVFMAACDRCFSALARPEIRFQGYEIHVGETFYEAGARPLADIVRQGISGSVPDGAVNVSGRVLGTYVHGFFDNDDFRHAFLAAARRAVDLPLAETWANVGAEREARIDRLADHLRNHWI